MVVNKLNRHELDKMAQLCTKMKVDRLFIAHMQPTPHGLRDDIFLPPEEWEKIDAELISLKQMYRMPIQQSAGFYDLIPLSHCKFLRNGALNIDYRGRLTVCCQLSNTGGEDDTAQDVVADLNKVPLAVGHQKLLDVYNEIHKSRLQKMNEGKLSKLDSFHCWYCLKHFKKVSFMKKHTDNAWVQQDPELKAQFANENKVVEKTIGESVYAQPAITR
jgi:MoaA/NifB/PqqE/SkfB family radical SAM enzyme